MTLHTSTFEYLMPSPAQKDAMALARSIFFEAAAALEPLIPDGPDKTYLMRQFRDCAMWANIAITRNPDGSPRS